MTFRAISSTFVSAGVQERVGDEHDAIRLLGVERAVGHLVGERDAGVEVGRALGADRVDRVGEVAAPALDPLEHDARVRREGHEVDDVARLERALHRAKPRLGDVEQAPDVAPGLGGVGVVHRPRGVEQHGQDDVRTLVPRQRGAGDVDAERVDLAVDLALERDVAATREQAHRDAEGAGGLGAEAVEALGVEELERAPEGGIGTGAPSAIANSDRSRDAVLPASS